MLAAAKLHKKSGSFKNGNNHFNHCTEIAGIKVPAIVIKFGHRKNAVPCGLAVLYNKIGAMET